MIRLGCASRFFSIGSFSSKIVFLPLKLGLINMTQGGIHCFWMIFVWLLNAILTGLKVLPLPSYAFGCNVFHAVQSISDNPPAALATVFVNRKWMMFLTSTMPFDIYLPLSLHSTKVPIISDHYKKCSFGWFLGECRLFVQVCTGDSAVPCKLRPVPYIPSTVIFKKY